MKIRFITNDNILLNKQLYFPTITIIIRCIFEKKMINTISVFFR